MPILKTLAEGVTESRMEIRTASCRALFDALLDRHAEAVPPGLLIEIIGNVLSPTIVKLGCFILDDLVDHVDDGEASRSEKKISPRKSATMEFEELQYVKTTSHDSKAHGEMSAFISDIELKSQEPCSSNKSLVIDALNCLNQVFLLHIQKLVQYPSFDKLWLRILFVFGYFLNTVPDSTDPTYVAVVELARTTRHGEELAEKVSSAMQVQDSCNANLQVLLTTMAAERIFEKRGGLYIITTETVSQFHNSSKAAEILALFNKK